MIDAYRETIQLFIVNLSVIFFLYFFYHKFVEEKFNKSTNIVLLILLNGIAIILCMEFSIQPMEGFIFDVRQLPFIIGTLYGGRRVGFILLVILLSYRYYIGGDGVYVAVFEFGALYCIMLYLTPLFQKEKLEQKRVIIASLVALFSVISLAVFMYIFSELSITPYNWLILAIIHVGIIISVALFVKFIEKARHENQLLYEVKKLEKLRVVSDIAASISHEVRNPLTVTRGFLQLLKDPSIQQEKRLEYIDLSLNELDRADVIITDYLTFAKPSLENIEILRLDSELEYVIKVVQPYATLNNVEIEYEDKVSVFVAGERQKLHQCFINLMKNGIEAMPSGGILEIQLTEFETNACIRVRDSGVGLSQEQIRKLGMPYYTTKDKGTGLGTMVVYSIVKAMRGKISVESIEGEGTTFTILLPVVSN